FLFFQKKLPYRKKAAGFRRVFLRTLGERCVPLTRNVMRPSDVMCASRVMCAFGTLAEHITSLRVKRATSLRRQPNITCRKAANITDFFDVWHTNVLLAIVSDKNTD
ncbi:MAG: hypothetical protein IKS88_01375, partial [Clostridia bacterium]|nr:hypothetical protein [Clostridia bacterium]